MPTTTVPSCPWMEANTCWPSPGRLKIVSTMIEPPSMLARSAPMKVTAGISELRSPWRVITRVRFMPLAVAVRT